MFLVAFPLNDFINKGNGFFFPATPVGQTLFAFCTLAASPDVIGNATNFLENLFSPRRMVRGASFLV